MKYTLEFGGDPQDLTMALTGAFDARSMRELGLRGGEAPAAFVAIERVPLRGEQPRPPPVHGNEVERVREDDRVAWPVVRDGDANRNRNAVDGRATGDADRGASNAHDLGPLE